jgi:hypothetical protein
MPLRKRNATDVFSGENPWIADSRMLVAYAMPRNANMASTVTAHGDASSHPRTNRSD